MIIGEETASFNIRVPENALNSSKDMPSFSAYLIAIVRDSNGKVIQVYKQRSHSPTANFIALMLPYTWFASNGASLTLTNTGGGTCSFSPGLARGAACIPYPDINTGNEGQPYIVMIQVGSGQQSNPYSAHSLAAPIANGNGAGQLVYGKPLVSSNISVSGNSSYFYISQLFSNNSGATINITEVGIILQFNYYSTYYDGIITCNQLLVWYDALSTSISIPNGGGLVIYYTFTVNP